MNPAPAAPLTASEIADDMVRRGDAAREGNHYQEAAFLYAEALRLSPGRQSLQVQCGHMFKESGDLDAAQLYYKAAAELAPNDPDLALQLGHFYKCAGRLAQASTSYRKALALKPRWDIPHQELKRLRQAGWRDPGEAADVNAVGSDESGLLASETQTLTAVGRAMRIAPELRPLPLLETLHAHQEGIELRRLGKRERTHWGILPVLRGVEALRGFCISAAPVLRAELILNGQMIYRGGLGGGFELTHESENTRLRKYVFNIWIDLSGFVQGRYELEYRVIDLNHRTRSRVEDIVIAAPLSSSVFHNSDGVVALPNSEDARSLDEQINARPSMIRSGRRALLKEAPRAVLVQRADQLGDLVVSVPALRRLRELFPTARIVGLISAANAELALKLRLFDEIVTVEFPDDPWERRRIMAVEAQARLAARLASFEFDVAIDLSENASSRLLLPLSGAPFLVGFPSGEMTGFAIEAAGFTHDPWNGHEVVPHANKLLGLIEWVGAMLRSEPNLEKPEDPNSEALLAFGLPPGVRFAVLHDGARLQFSRWPHYFSLATLLLKRTDLRVVMLTDHPPAADSLPEALAQSDRFQLVGHRLPFDQFDALVSFCAVFVGNDSGPKHLAALRGANVVSVHMARNNWNEWGQENGGLIVSRKLPCAGCLIWHDPEECGKDYVCIRHIKPEEVFEAVERLIGPGDRAIRPVGENAERLGLSTSFGNEA